MQHIPATIEEQLFLKAIREECPWENLPKRLQATLNSKEEWHRRLVLDSAAYLCFTFFNCSYKYHLICSFEELNYFVLESKFRINLPNRADCNYYFSFLKMKYVLHA